MIFRQYFSMAVMFLSIFFTPSLLGTAFAVERFYSIQLAAFRSVDGAAKMVDHLKNSGHNAHYGYATITGKGNWYRVYVGRFGSYDQAKEAAERLKQLNSVSNYFVRAIGIQGPEEAIGKALPPLVINDITFELKKDGKEVVFVHSNRLFSPSIFALEGERPRLVVDIKNTGPFRKDLSKIALKGKLISEIRTHFHRDSETLRIVLDYCSSNKNYIVRQVSYGSQNIFALEVGVQEMPEREGPESITENEEWGQLSDIPETKEHTGIHLRQKGEDMSPDDVEAMLLRHNFYSSCWNHNGAFCNPQGKFDNFLTDNEDGTVTDRATNLMWQQSGSSYAMTREEAGDYVQQINQQNFAGYSDWRLPTLEELASLMESTLKNEGLFIEEVFDSEQKSCWSVDTYGPERNWKANLQLGTVIDTPFTCGNSVRAVRSLQNDGSSKNQEKGYFKSLYSELLRKSELRK
jgi:hypothetical protein